MSRISTQRILITGAASGMGRLMAQRFAALGARVVLVDRDRRGVDELAHEIDGAVAVEADVTDADAVDQLRAMVQDVDILVNNAGVLATGAYLDVDTDAEALVMNVNMRGVHLITKAFLPDLIASENGHLVMMSSAAALIGIPYQAVYSATKWFVAGLAESLRRELQVEGHTHVHVTVVCPGVVDTGFFDRPAAPAMVPTLRPEKVVDRVVSAVRHNRPYVREPFMVKLIPLLRGVLPTRLIDAVGAWLGMHRIVERTPMASAGRKPKA